MRNVAFIPVREGSTSIPLKNIKPMCGKPLVYWTASAAAGADCIDEVYVATDSDSIRDAVVSMQIPKVSVIGRSPETATATATSESALLEFAESHEFDNVAFIQATSPLLDASDVERGIAMLERGECDSVLSVVADKRFYWRIDAHGAIPVNYDVYARPRRQDFDGWYMENGALYIASRTQLLESRNRVSGRIGLLVMAEDSGIEIDEPSDWIIVQHLLARKLGTVSAESQQTNEVLTLRNNVGLFLSDCDGCLTDGGMYYSENGDEYKKFNTRDGMAFQLLREAGIKTGIVTGENSHAAKRRAEKLQTDYIEIGCKDKLTTVKCICEKEGISLSQLCYVGDDLNDLPIMRAVSDSGGITACPANAVTEVRSIATYVCENSGGHGAVREIIELLTGGSVLKSASGVDK